MRLPSSPHATIWQSLYAIIPALAIGALLVGFTVRAMDTPPKPAAGQKVVTIYDEGKRRVVLTNAQSVRDVLSQAHATLAAHDVVEPAESTPIPTSDFTVNIYRAHPFVVIDGARRSVVMSPHTSPRDIVKDAKLALQNEDIVQMRQAEDVIAAGAGSEVQITRAKEVNLVLYGKKTTVYSQAATVADFLKEKSITLASDDTMNAVPTTTITPGMTLEIWRNGIQTVTESQSVDYKTEQIQDPNQKVGYREVKTPGVKGEKSVTYEVMMKNGKEESRKEIQSVVTKQPTSEVVVVGSKPDFDGDFAAALAKLRSCEGGYNSINPAGPYYGAYQFDQRTWASVSSAPYGSASPAEQDAAARALYVRRGWSPWPVCGRGLPDTFR